MLLQSCKNWGNDVNSAITPNVCEQAPDVIRTSLSPPTWSLGQAWRRCSATRSSSADLDFFITWLQKTTWDLNFLQIMRETWGNWLRSGTGSQPSTVWPWLLILKVPQLISKALKEECSSEWWHLLLPNPVTIKIYKVHCIDSTSILLRYFEVKWWS